MTMKKVRLTTECDNSCESRIGGGAFIGGIVDWPKTANGEDLTLIASICGEMLIPVLGHIAKGKYVSVFSYYSAKDYFLDEITYHGDQDELDYIYKNHTTKVLVHEKGDLIQKGCLIKPMLIKQNGEVTDTKFFCGSGFGGAPNFLQIRDISFEDKTFVLQLYSGDYPEPYRDIFGLSDAVGYLHINKDFNGGLFFTQTT
ncbi:MAG: hypothetical protein FWG14_01470 [Peptococcaceae bacterium]|nr:hypothetical protein [Peptococcaceae bacterium]